MIMGSARRFSFEKTRQENSREPKQPRWLSYAEIQGQFNEIMLSIQQKSMLADDLVKRGQKEDAEDIWRSQIVFAFSALDYFMHELAVYGVVSIFDKSWTGEKSESYQNIEISLKELEDVRQMMIEDTDNSAWLREKMKRRYESKTFMNPTEIKKLLKTLGIDAETVLPSQLHTEISNAYDRRCKIVHAADRDINTKTRVPLAQKDADDIMKSITRLADNITREVQAKESG